MALRLLYLIALPHGSPAHGLCGHKPHPGMAHRPKAGRHRRGSLNSPEGNVYHGALITCVFKKATAACLNGDENSPDFGRCKLSCSNIARTDRDIASTKDRAQAISAELERVLPEPIRQRFQARLDHYLTTIASHEDSRRWSRACSRDQRRISNQRSSRVHGRPARISGRYDYDECVRLAAGVALTLLDCPRILGS
jgi:hypothetical protein